MSLGIMSYFFYFIMTQWSSFIFLPRCIVTCNSAPKWLLCLHPKPKSGTDPIKQGYGQTNYAQSKNNKKKTM